MVLGFLIATVIIGVLAAAVTGIGLVGVVVWAIVFFGGLPALLPMVFVHHEVSYHADRADARQKEADHRADMRDVLQDRRPRIIHDNRQIHFHGGGE
jgi:hypothetical protein